MQATNKALATAGTGTATVTYNKDIDPSLYREGTRIVLPENMPLDKAIEVLVRKKTEEQTAVDLHEEIESYPLDGAHALMAVLRETFGWAQAVPKVIKTMFGKQEIAPTIVNLQVGHNEHTQVFWGDFAIPGIDGALSCGAGLKNGRPIFVIKGKILQKDMAAVKAIAQKTRDYVRAKSVYRGKAIRLVTDDKGMTNVETPPSFLDLSRVNEDELVFSDNVMEQIRTSLFTPVEKTEHCRKHKIPLKRGVLLEGRYGCGKTLTAFVTAKKCQDNGWTFIYLDRVSGLKGAMMFATQYSPAVIFAEDIDRVVQGERSVAIDDVLNQIDGIESKGTELLTILTTNYVEKIEKAMMRPGRLDAVISVHAPDAKAAEKLVRIYARDLIAEDENLQAVGRELDGQIPAMIREVVERSKLYAISRIEEGQDLKLQASDLIHAARAMKRHQELMEEPKQKELTAEQALGVTMAKLVSDGLDNKLNGSATKIAELHKAILMPMPR